MDDPSSFREAMSRFPSGVVIATTLDGGGEPRGFTASSFSSVSLEPPLVLVCLSATAGSHPAFEEAHYFGISILRPEHEEIARRFGTRGADKFGPDDFATGPRGLPLLRGALAALTCVKQALMPGGDHSILLGRAETVELGTQGPALVHHRRQFWELGGEGD